MASGLPPAANFATAERGVDFDIWPPVLEYTSVSSTRMFTFVPEAKHVVQPAVADIIRPAVAADDPDAALHEMVSQGEQALCFRIFDAGEFLLQSSNAVALLVNAGFISLIGIQQARHRSSPMVDASFCTSSRAISVCLSIVSRMPRPNSALSSKSEFDQAGPRPSLFFVHGVVGRLPP